MTRPRKAASVAALLAALALAASGCGGSSGSTAAPAEQAETTASLGATLVSPAEAAALIATDDVEVLDVRTPEEYAEGHVEGATLIDFYEPDFAARIAELDRDREYVVYCRSGNRSGQAVELMVEQGFVDVNDVDGGILAWEATGLPITR